ncbi:hypothetical protein AB1N83_008102 [Pleurotus pulmonarius]
MGQWFEFINFDKHQVHQPPMRKFGELGGNGIVSNLIALEPYPKLDTALTRIFLGYNPSNALSCNRAALGRLGKLPVELIALIFRATDLDGATMLCITHAQLFAIGYSTALVKAKAIALSNNWAYDRIILFGDYSDSLPAGFLSPAERYHLMKWGIARKAAAGEESEGSPLEDVGGPTDPEDEDKGGREARERQRDEALATYEDQSFHLYTYGGDMPPLHGASRAGEWSAEVEYGRMRRTKSSRLDAKRLHRTRVLMHFNPYNPRLRRISYTYETGVLINITKRDFVPAVDEEGRWVLDLAIPVLIVWGHDDGYPGNMMKGKWAGDRLAIISAEEMKMRMQEEDGWTERKERWSTEPA